MEIESTNSSEKSDGFQGQNRQLVGLVPLFILVIIIVLRISWTLYKSFGQKTRNPQQRRMYGASRARPSLGQTEPSIYVSPSNLPPPPKYECMAPPSYEEVVGVHYPNYTPQPITQPISTALANAVAQSTSNAEGNSSRNNDNDTAIVTSVTRNNADNSGTETVVTVQDRRSSVTAASS